MCRDFSRANLSRYVPHSVTSDMEFDSGPRLSGDRLYRSIAEENYERFEELQSKLESARSKSRSIRSECDDPENPPIEYHEAVRHEIDLRGERDKCAVQVVVFAAMYLEAFIYDFAAWKESDSYIKKYLDGLDFISKWVVIPRLVIGEEIPRGSQAMELLVELKSNRNRLVHLKSRSAPAGEKLAEYMKQEEERTVSSARNAHKAILEVEKELKKIAPEHIRVSFLDHPEG